MRRAAVTLDPTFELAPVGLAELSLDGRFTRSNGRLCSMLGFSCDALLARDLDSLTHADDAEVAHGCLRRLSALEATSCAWDQRVRHADDSWQWMHVALTLVESAGAVPARFIGVFTDASTRKELEQRFSVQYAVSRALAESESAEDAVPRVLEELAHHLGWRFAAYWTMNEAEGAMHAVDSWHVGDADVEKFARATAAMPLATGVGLPGRTWQSRSPHWCADVVTDGNFPRAADAARAGLHGAFAFPICAGERMLGVIEVLGDTVQPPNRSMLETAEAIGNQIGQFLARRQLADAERASQARNTAMIESSLDCVITIDHHGRILEFNPAAERTFRTRRADVLGLAIGDVIVPPALREAHRNGMARYLATREAHVLGQRLELPAVRADGSEFPVEITITRVPLPGDPVFTAYLRDVTDRKTREARDRVLLEASEVLGSSLDYEATLRALTDIVVPSLADWYAVDLMESGTLRRLVVSHRDPLKMVLAEELERRYPMRPTDATGVPNVIRTGQTEVVAQIDAAMLAAGSRDAEHLRLVQQLGLVSYMAVPVRTSEGTAGVITFVSAESNRHYGADDVLLAEELARRASHAIDNARLFRRVEDARQLLEQQSIQLEMQAEELRTTNEQLEGRTQEANRANRTKSEFLASMSHELRTPLNAVLGYVQLMAEGIRGPVTEAQLADLDRIERSAQHLLGLINDILNFAKLEAGHVRYRIVDVWVDDLLSGVGDLIGPQLRTKELRYTYEPGDAAVTVQADRDKLVQVMLNLLSNAVKFTEPGGEVRVRWTADTERVDIFVVDTGRGIKLAELETIFEPFVQVGRERGELAHGTGLGLAISRELARAMGGELSVASAPGNGSTFTFSLPR